jgi:hypothetical protein
MNAEDSDLLLRLASREPRALESLYDAHARSVYGYALAMTRRPREARRTLIRVFEALARAPESASGSLSLRRHLLSLTRPIAWSERSRWGFRGLRRRSSYALDPASAGELKDETERAGADAVESVLLRAVEGIDGPLEETTTSSASRGAWRPPPASLRSLVLLRAREAARPVRRYVRWLASWGLLVGAVLLALASEAVTPRLPDIPYTLPTSKMGPALKDELQVRRQLHWILEGFRGEVKTP